MLSSTASMPGSMAFAIQPTNRQPSATIARALSKAWLRQPRRRPTTSTTGTSSARTRSACISDDDSGAAQPPTPSQFYNINSYETVERLIRRGVYKGPLVMNWVAISGGMDAPNIYNLANFVRAIPDGAMLTVESSMRNVLPINMMGIAMGLHVRCGIEDNLWNQSRTGKMSTVRQIEQLVRISREFGREIASAKEARKICKIGVFYDTVEDTLFANGFAPNPRGGHQGFLRKAA